MKYFMFWVYIGLAYAFEENILTNHIRVKKDLNNQLQFNPEATKISIGYLENTLPHQYKSQTFQPISIRSEIPPDLLIPSVSAAAAGNIGLNNGIPINQNLNFEPYSVDSSFGSSFGNAFPSTNFEDNLSGIQSKVITIPTQQIQYATGFNPIINLNKPVGFATGQLETIPVENLESIIGSTSSRHTPNSVSIQKALSVDKLVFSEDKNLRGDTEKSFLISVINKLESSKENTKSGYKPPKKVSYSIEQVPEVASFHSTGPLVPSDIPSISEITKIFNSKSTSQIETNKPTKITTLPSENSDDDVLALIEERMGSGNRKKEKNLDILGIESNNTVTTRQPLKPSSTETQSHIDSSAAVTLITEIISSRIKSNASSDTSTSKDYKNEANESDKHSNETLDDSTGSIKSRIFGSYRTYDADTFTESNIISSSGNNLPVLNRTGQGSSIPVVKLKANSFLNVNDILKETSDVSATTGTSKHPGLLKENKTEVNSSSINSLQNITLEKKGPNNDSAFDRIALIVKNANDSQESTTERVTFVSAPLASKSNDSDLSQTSELKKETVKTTVSSLVNSRVDIDLNSSPIISSENNTDVKAERVSKIDNLQQTSEAELETLNLKVSKNGISCNCGGNTSNITTENPSESEILTHINDVTTTNSTLLSLDKRESSFSNNTGLEETINYVPSFIALTLNNTVTKYEPSIISLISPSSNVTSDRNSSLSTNTIKEENTTKSLNLKENLATGPVKESVIPTPISSLNVTETGDAESLSTFETSTKSILNTTTV